jgi:hypothetical protein
MMTGKPNELPEDPEAAGPDREFPDTAGDQPTDTVEDIAGGRSEGGPPGGGDETGGGFFSSIPNWAWVVIALSAVILIVLIFSLTSGDDADHAAAISTTTEPETTTTEVETTTTTEPATTTTTEPATTTTTEPATTTTTEPATTTTTEPATTTTTQPATTTTTVPPVEVGSSPLFAFLGVDLPPYGDDEVFEPGEVEVQWYQWNSLFVVLFRGVRPEANLCLGNSILSGNSFDFHSNSKLGDEEPCQGPAGDDLAGEAFGVRACGELVYYLTEIPTSESGALFGSADLWAVPDAISGATDVSGVTGVVDTELGDPPEFDPTAIGYVLPASDADDLSEVDCG